MELANARVLLVGAGGVGGEIADGLVKKGVGALTVCDEDVVDPTNLNRQQFREDDIGENKAQALIKNLAPRGITGTELRAYPYHFQDALALGAAFAPDLVICAPDNDAARVAVCEQYHDHVPVVYTGLDMEANGGYVFVHETQGPCFQCFRPKPAGGGSCPQAPAVIDPTKLVAGLVLYAIDSLMMERPREWNAFEFHLSGILPTKARAVKMSEKCPHHRDQI